MNRPTLLLVDHNRKTAQMLTRLLRAASSGAPVHHASSFDEAPALPRTRLIVCSEDTVREGLAWSDHHAPTARFLCWSQDTTEVLLSMALRDKRITSILGWPIHRSLPRPLEVTYAVRRALGQGGPGPGLSDLLHWGGAAATWRPATTSHQRQVVQAVANLSEELGLNRRAVAAATDAAHELLMNAMYDAPVIGGEAVFAQDRTAEITLEAAHVPKLQLVCDGMHLGLQVIDPFGRLTRERALQSMGRGIAAATTTGGAGPLDTSHGGAGLGLMRLYSTGAATLFDVVPGRSTRVTWLFDLTTKARDLRGLPNSLHLYL